MDEPVDAGRRNVPPGHDLYGKWQAHPFADKFSLMQGAAFEELVEDIRQRGQLIPCLVSNGLLLDGRNRLRACQALGIKPNIRAVPATTNEDYVGIITSANVIRRHLTIEEKKQYCELALIEAPGLSNRRIAKATHLEHHTVAKIREALETEGKIATTDERLGADGRVRTVRTVPDHTEADLLGPEADVAIVDMNEEMPVEPAWLGKPEEREPEPLTLPEQPLEIGVDSNFNIEMKRLLDGLNALYQDNFERKRLLTETAAMLKLWRADARAKKAITSKGGRVVWALRNRRRGRDFPF
jgi:hypothetical protein